jgi:hypothetical protein
MAVGSSLRQGVTTRSQGAAGAFAETPRASRMRHTPVFSPVHSALAGGGADGHRDPTPGVAPRGDVGQMQHEPAHGPFHPDRQFQHALAQRRDLCRGAGRALRLAAQLLEQHIRRRGEQHAELIGPEPGATRPPQGQPVMQCLEPVLHIAPLTVETVDRRWGLAQVRHHEARIEGQVGSGLSIELRGGWRVGNLGKLDWRSNKSILRPDPNLGCKM